METKYKKLFNKHFKQSPELCGYEICSFPINIARYFYYQYINVN